MVDKIILFDGFCNLCDRTVKFIQKHDHTHKLKMIPVSSAKGQEIMKSFQLNQEDTDSVVYFEMGKPYMKSQAFFRIINQIGGNFRLLLVFSIFPKRFTDWIYDVIARSRYSWFGKKNICSAEDQLPDNNQFKHF